MTDEEAIDLGKRAIYHATYRDAMSGGVNNGLCYYMQFLIDKNDFVGLVSTLS